MVPRLPGVLAPLQVATAPVWAWHGRHAAPVTLHSHSHSHLRLAVASSGVRTSTLTNCGSLAPTRTGGIRHQMAYVLSITLVPCPGCIFFSLLPQIGGHKCGCGAPTQVLLVPWCAPAHAAGTRQCPAGHADHHCAGAGRPAQARKLAAEPN